jgi:hypothetical protein
MTAPIWLDAAGRPRPTRACWTCGREVAPMRFRDADLRAGRRSRPPHPGLVRLHDGVPASAGGPRMVAPGADLGAGPGGEPPPALRARRAPLTAHADSASSATAPRRHPDHAGPKYYRDAKIGKIYRRKGAAGVARVPAHHHPEPGVVRGPRGHGLLGRGLDREDMAVARPARRVEGEAADVGALRGFIVVPSWEDAAACMVGGSATSRRSPFRRRAARAT